MSNPRAEIDAMRTAHQALADLPADQRTATLAAVQAELDRRDIETAIDDAQAAGLIEDVT